LTGQLAIGLVGVLCVGAVTFGVGMASTRYQVSDIGAWLSAAKKGTLVHANGMAGKIDGKVRLPGTMYGHEIKIVQDGSTILIVDQQTGVVSRIDPAQLDMTKSTSAFAAVGVQIVVGKGMAYAVDPAKATVQRIDPITLTTMETQTTLTAPLGQAAIDGRGTLWVPVPATGQVVPFQGGHQAAPMTVGKPKDSLAITIAAGVPIITNSTAATALILDPSGKQLTVALPPMSKVGPGGVLFPAATEGQIVPLLVKETGLLVLLDTVSGRHSTVPLQATNHRYGPPQILGSKVYIPDQTAGSLIVYNFATNAFDPSVVVGGRPGPLEVFVSGGLLWADDPHGDRAVVLEESGAVKEIQKYDDKVPGGPRHPIPTQGRPGNQGEPSGNGGSSPGNGGNSPVSPQPTRTPEPLEPPTPPSNLRTSGDVGFMTIDFQPSVGGKPTGYVLKDVPTGMKATPSAIALSETPSFRVNGGTCGQEYRFRVAVRYQDRNGQLAEAPSAPSGPVTPCVPPGAPRNLQAVAEATGAKVTWAAPLGMGNAPVSYRVSWTGPTTGVRNGLTGTSVSLGEIWKNGQYTFTVTSSNGAGAGQETQVGSHLVGPPQSYAIRHNGKSKGYIRVAPDGVSATAGTIFDNGHMVTVHCQKMGAYYNRGLGPNFSGSLYDYVEYAGIKGYMIGYLVSTPGNPWQQFAGPPLWECE
jgi:hypothetical protein